MTAYSPTACSPAADTHGGPATAVRAARRLAVLLAAPFAAVAKQLRVRRTAMMLQELDDRTLADIGLHRTQIISTATQVIDWPHVDPRRVVR